MATFDVAKLLNKITQDIPGINTVLKALAKWDVSALTDVPDGAMQATTDANNNLTIKKKVSGSYTPVAKLMHDVDKLDGYHASASATANAVAVRNAQGALPGNILGNSATADTATALATGSVVPVNQGGTGATTASQARANLGAADGADFTTHIAKQSSPSVEGHVKLDALAADGSNTAAPGGYGLGKGLSATTDYNNCVVNGWYCGSTSTANKPPTTATSSYHVFVQAINTNNVLQKAYHVGGNSYYTRVRLSGVWSEWVLEPKGITDSTSTTSSNIAASATAVKAAYDRAKQVATASISGGIKVGGAISSVSSDGTVTLSPATTTSRGISRVATLADMEPGAVVENGPAVLAAGSEALNALVPTFLIGSIISTYAAAGYVPNGCVPTDGAEYTQSQFPSFYTDYLVAGKIVTCTYAEFAAQVALTGNCGKFALDADNQKFKVPLLKDGDSITQATSAGEIGKSVKAGLPNITATFELSGTAYGIVPVSGTVTGAFKRGTARSNTTAGTGVQGNDLLFDANASNQIYKDDVSTVLVEQVRLRHFVVLASAQNNASIFDWSSYMAGLAGKANNDLSNLTQAAKMSLFGIQVMTGSITLNGTTNNTVVMADIVLELGLEVGDVIRINTGAYNKLHTVESITNNNSIIVNYEHAGNRGNGSLKLPNSTGQATVTRVAKWFNASVGLGVNWVKVSRAASTTYTYLDGRRSLELIYTGRGNADSRNFVVTSSGVSIMQGYTNSSGNVDGAWIGSVTGEWSFTTNYNLETKYFERR